MKKYMMIGGFLIFLLAIGVLIRNRIPQDEVSKSQKSRDKLVEKKNLNSSEDSASGEGISQEEIQKSLEQNSASTDDESGGNVASSADFGEMDEEELNEMEDLYSFAEKKWSSISKDLFLHELDLSEEDYAQYQSLREDFEEERWRAFEDFHEEMLENPNDEVNATEYTEKIERELTQRYEDRVRELVGDQNFKAYLQRRQEFNEKLREKQDPRKGMLLIQL